MQCPNCHQAAEVSQFTCAACGHRVAGADLERLEHLNYLLAWLDEQGARVDAAAFRVLRGEAALQLETLRDQLLPRRPAEVVARELALVGAALDLIPMWNRTGMLNSAAAELLSRKLQAEAQALQSEQAGRTAAAEAQSRLQVVDGLLASLPSWWAKEYLTEADTVGLKAYLERERLEQIKPASEIARELAFYTDMLDWSASWQPVIGSAAASRLAQHLQRRVMELKAELAGRPATTDPITEEEFIGLIVDRLPAWAQAGVLSSEAAGRLRSHLQSERQRLSQPAAAPAEPLSSAVLPAAPAPMRAAAPPKPAAPPAPPFDWGQLWEQAWGLVVSGALLRGLLYLGAFMIIVAEIILTVSFWNAMPLWGQVLSSAVLPVTFYFGGFLLRAQYKLVVAGGAITGIGAVLAAVVFVAIYQFGGLAARGVDVDVYILAAAAFCTALYAFTAWRFPGRFFAYITLMAAVSLPLALSGVLRLSLEWRFVALALSSVGLVALAVAAQRLGRASNDLAVAARNLSQILLPAAVFLAVVMAVFVFGVQALAQVTIFALASVGYGLLAWRFPAGWSLQAGVGCSLGAIGFGLHAFGLPLAWHPAAAAACAPFYLLAARWLDRALDAKFAGRRIYVRTPKLAGLGLVAAAVIGGLLIVLTIDLWPGAAALALAAAVLAGCAYLYRAPVYALAASGLAVAPVSLVVYRALDDLAAPQAGAWLMAAWAALALAYLGLAAALPRLDGYTRWPVAVAHALTPLVLLGLALNFSLTYGAWFNGPTLAALGGAGLVYLGSAGMHHSRRYAALSHWVAWLPPSLQASAFLWPLGVLIPAIASIAWWGSVLPRHWLGAALAVLALAYIGLGQWLYRGERAYRLPWHASAYGLALAAIIAALGERLPHAVTLYVIVLTSAGLAAVHRRPVEVWLAAALLIWPFQLTLDLLNVIPHAQPLAYALLAAFAYLPAGLWLERAGRKFALPAYALSYGLALVAVIAAAVGPYGLYPQTVGWVGVVVPLIVTGQLIFSLRRFGKSPFAWAGAVIFPLAFGPAFSLAGLPAQFQAAAWVGLASAYLFGERLIRNVRPAEAWPGALRLPLGLGALALCGLGLLRTAAPTMDSLFGAGLDDPFSPILAQTSAVALALAAAWLYRSRWPLFAVPALAFVPVTLFFAGYSGSILGQALPLPWFGVVWAGLGLAHFLAAAALDRRVEPFGHGLYFGAYGLITLAVLWTVVDRSALVWTLGLGLAAVIGSAVLVHFGLHRTWVDLINALVLPFSRTIRVVARTAFVWVGAWGLPIWCVLLLAELGVNDGFVWLGLGVPALAMLGLAVRLRRLERAYAWPLNSAAQVGLAIGLWISAPVTVNVWTGSFAQPASPLYVVERLTTIGFTLLQFVGVAFYAGSAWAFRQRFFAHLAAWLVVVPYTLSWVVFQRPVQIALPWIGLSGALLVVGWALDRRDTRYAHGPYLAGYGMAAFALAASLTDRVVNLYTLGAVIGLALASQALVHSGRHRSFQDLVDFFWRRPGTTPRRAGGALFLFLAAYAFPFWLAQLLAQLSAPLAWRGLAFALAAPLYVAGGLAARRLRPEYAWPLHSAGYALTAIGAMIAFDDQLLAIYVLALNAIVYAVSAIIFRQSFWLYLSTLLVPVIGLLTLNYHGLLNATWIAPGLMGLAFAYLIVGRVLERRPAAGDGARGLPTFALPFYLPGYVLSALALAAATSERSLAIAVFAAGVVFYAASAAIFRESIFVYPAAWLAAVPYYLALTLTPVPPEWRGLGWLPLIVGYLVVGRFVLQRRLPVSERLSLTRLTHPALPFYLLAYGLSIGMVVQAQAEGLVLALALAAAGAIYFASAGIFRRFVWLYPALLATHLALLAYLTTLGGDQPHYAALPFHALTWLTALAGQAGQRRSQAPADPSLPAVRRSWRQRIFAPAWSQPFFLFAALDVIAWQAVALGGYDTTFSLGLGHTLLLALFAMLWLDSRLAYAAIGFLLLAAGSGLLWIGLPLVEALSYLGGLGLALYLVAVLVEWIGRWDALRLWLRPLTHSALALAGLGVAAGLAMAAVRPTVTAVTLAAAGATYLAVAYRRRRHRLGYLAMAMLQIAWALVLATRDIREPQWYAIPAGLYFTAIAYLERRRGNPRFAPVVESFGLAVLLVTTFGQSLEGGLAGLPYFALLIVEGLAVIAWGAWQRLKIPFFTGFAASALNVIGQVVLVFAGSSTPLRVLIIGSVGLVIVAAAVLIERQRAAILVRARDWRNELETWR